MPTRRIFIPTVVVILTTLLLAGLAAYPAQAQPMAAIHAGHAALQATPAPAEPTSTSSGEWKRILNRYDLKRSGVSGAYDPLQKRIVTFGGLSPTGALLQDTLVFTGTNWLFLGTGHKPPARKWHGFVYDSKRKVFVLFGGQGQQGNLNDTWEFDGMDWKYVDTPHKPSPRNGFAMVYDSCLGKVVLFGGATNSGKSTETWEYDGRDWYRISTQNTPQARHLTAAAFDDYRCRTVLFGGAGEWISGTLQGLKDTWEFDGVDWHQIDTPVSPPARWAHAVTYDVNHQKVILFGGYGPSYPSGGVLNDTWEYDGNNWMKIESSSKPNPREQHGLVYDPDNHRVILFFGGWTYGDTWEFTWGEKVDIANIRRSHDSINRDGCPDPTESVIRADISAPSGLAWVRLYYQNPGSDAWDYKPMTKESDHTYKVNLGPFHETGKVRYFIKVRDNKGVELSSPIDALTVNECLTLNLFDPEYGGCGQVTVNGYVGATIGHVTRLAWDWGDGTTTYHSWFPATHQYAHNGIYTVTVTAYADWGGTKTEEKRALVLDVEKNVLNISVFRKNVLESLDPIGVSTTEIVNRLFAGLTKIDSETLQPEPDLASTWTASDDGKTYTFVLREGLTWSDGVPLTAEDVRFSLLRALAPESDDYPAWMLSIIKNAESYHKGDITDPNQVGVKVLDARHIQFELNHPAVYFPAILAVSFYHPVPKHVVEAWGNDWSKPDHIVTSGPYLVAGQLSDGALVLQKNTNYYAAAQVDIAFTRVNLVENQDALSQYRSGDLDTIPLVSSEDMDAAFSDPILNQEIHTTPGNITYYLGFNTSLPPFDNPNVRKAFASAIDRRQLLRTLGLRRWKPSLTLTSSGIFGHVDGYKEGVGHPFSPSQARMWLEKAGYPNGRGLPPVTLVFVDNEFYRTFGDQLKQTWQRVLGVDVQVEYVDWREYVRRFSNGELQMFRSGWMADYNDAYNFLNDIPKGREKQLGNWHNSAFEETLSTAIRTEDPAMRKALYKQAEKILVDEDTVLVPLYESQGMILSRPYLQRDFSSEPDYAAWRFLRTETLIPTSGGTLTSKDGHVVIDIPQNTFAHSVRFTLEPATGKPAPAGMTKIGQVYKLGATNPNTCQEVSPVSGKTFSMTVHYSDNIPALEDQLALYYWDGDRWAKEDSSALDVSTNKITVHSPMLSKWAVMGQARTLYLPAWMR